MNHSFVASQIDTTKCARCHFKEIDHTNRATCEACGNSGTCEILYGNMLLCMDCIDKEKIAQAENMKPENQAKRLQEMAKAIDNSIQVRTDFFNAEVISHIEVFKAIDADDSITNKPYAKAEFLSKRHADFQAKIFEARQTLDQANNAVKAIQSTFNDIANKLREEERNKLKLSDTSYVVQAPKTIKPKGTHKPTAKAWSKLDVRLAAAEYKVPVDAVQMVCVSRNFHPVKAAMMLCNQINGTNHDWQNWVNKEEKAS